MADFTDFVESQGRTRVPFATLDAGIIPDDDIKSAWDPSVVRDFRKLRHKLGIWDGQESRLFGQPFA